VLFKILLVLFFVFNFSQNEAGATLSLQKICIQYLTTVAKRAVKILALEALKRNHKTDMNIFNLLNGFSNNVDVEQSVHLSSIIESCVNIGLPGISIIIQLSSN